MENIYLAYIIGCIASLMFWRYSRLASVVGFGISSVASAAGAYYFLCHITTPEVLEVHFPLANAVFRLDPLSAFFSFVISFVALAVSIYSIQYSKEYEERGENIGLFAFFFNLFILAMLLVVSVSDVFWFMVFWEVMTAVSYFLVCFNDEPKTLKATAIYMTISHIGGVGILLALLFMARASHSMEFVAFSHAQLSAPMVVIVFFLAFFGFGSKAGFVPLHVWLPQVHPQAPSNISALMSGVMIKAGIYGIVRFCTWLPLHEWMGILILVTGAISANVGVLYGLMEHNIKVTLADTSIENIGIIMLGMGVGVYGIAVHNPLLATIGFLASLYHVLGHATFKTLLFLGAGSVLYRVHTKNIEVLGGLAKKMPLSAFAALIGSMAIAGIPPLNGSVSEWFTYQSMIHATITGSWIAKLIFPLSIALFSLAGALGVWHFVKVYSTVFSGVPRRKELWDKAKEVPISMTVGMYILVVGCIAFGLGAPYVAKEIMKSAKFLSSTSYHVAGNLAVYSTLHNSMTSPLLIAILLTGMIIIPLVITAIYKDSLSSAVRETPPWVCGVKYSPRMQMTAAPFTSTARKLFSWFYQPKIHFEETNGYFGPVKYSAEPREIFWDILYKPVIKAVNWTAKKVRNIQEGNVELYASYMFIGLLIFLLISIL